MNSDQPTAQSTPSDQGARRRLASPIAWTLYAAVPVSGWGWLSGLPLGVLEAGAVALVWWVWASGGRLPGMRALAALTVAKLLLGGLLIDRGFAARYYANDAWTAPVERSLEFRRNDLTRHDWRIAFGGAGQPDLPLHFLNHLRFNYYRPEEPKRDRLAYSVAWTGFIEGTGPPSTETFYLAAAESVRGELLVDEQTTIALDGGSERTASVALASGWHSLTVRVAAPYGSGRRIEAGTIVDGVRRPFDGRRISIAPVDGVLSGIDPVIRWLSRVIDVAVLSWLGVLVAGCAREAWRDGQVGRLLWLAAIVEALLYACPYARRVVVLGGGDDWLFYEHLARAIVADPLLRQRGLGAGQGEPFYFQALYPYFIALVHQVFGESIFGVALVQRLLVAGATGWVASITTRLFGERAGWIALIGGGSFLYVKLGRWSDVLLAEPLFTPVLIGWMLLLLRTATEAYSWPRLTLTGVTGGIATLLRSTFLTTWPLVIPLWSLVVRRHRLRATVLLVATMIAVFGMLAVRNWTVSGTLMLTPSSGPITLYLGNTPPPSLSPAPSDREAMYERLQLSVYSRQVLEFALQEPTAFLGNLGRKTLYSLGLFGLSGLDPNGASVPDVSLLYVGIWCTALIATIRLPSSSRWQPWALLVLPAVPALCHFGAHVIFWPNSYGDRMILPVYGLLIPYAAFGVEPVVIWARNNGSHVAPLLGAAVALSIFFPASARSSDVVMVLLVTAIILAIRAEGEPVGPRHWRSYIVYAAGFVVLMFARSLGADSDFDVRRHLWLPVIVFIVGRLARQETTHRAMLAMLIIGPFFTRAAADRVAISHPVDPFLWVFAGMMAVSLSLLTRSRGRVAAAASIGCLVFALVLPFLPGINADMMAELGDIRRDVVNVTGGNQQARQEFIDDVTDAAGHVFEPFVTVATVVTGNASAFSAFCLLAVWIQVILAGRWNTALEGRRAELVSYAGLLVAFLAALMGSPAEVWHGGGYSLAAFAILLGLAHARFARATDPAPTVTVP